MSIADYLILVAAILPYIMASIAKGSATAFDNADPRNPDSYKGKALRAWNAQLNSFEIFPFFSIAVLLAEFRGAPQLYINALAALFIILRIIYLFIYVKNRTLMRTPIWTLGFLVTVALFLLPAFYG